MTNFVNYPTIKCRRVVFHLLFSPTGYPNVLEYLLFPADCLDFYVKIEGLFVYKITKKYLTTHCC